MAEKVNKDEIITVSSETVDNSKKPSDHTVQEWMDSNSFGVRKHVILGAAKEKNLKLTDMISRSELEYAIKHFLNIKV